MGQQGRNAKAREELEKAKQIAVDASESRQRIINAALENMKVAFFSRIFNWHCLRLSYRCFA